MGRKQWRLEQNIVRIYNICVEYVDKNDQLSCSVLYKNGRFYNRDVLDVWTN